MSKRFFDTNTWAKPWFRELSPAEKTAWFYILTHCDAVGAWDADTKMADFCIGDAVDWEHLKAASNGNIEVMENGKWWMVDFCRYQYGKKVRPSRDFELKVRKEYTLHDNIHALLLQHGLWERYLSTVGTTVEENKEEVEVEGKREEKELYADAVALTKGEYTKLVARAGEKVTKAAVEKLSAWKLAKGATYKSDYHAILTWVLGAVTGQKGGAIPAPKAAPAPGPPCPECGVECVREFGYWTCGVHGRKEELG